MEGMLKYTVIKSDEQYLDYTHTLHLLLNKSPETSLEDEINLLNLLINKYNSNRYTFNYRLNPVQRLLLLMEKHKLKEDDLKRLLQPKPGLISDVLNNKKRITKNLANQLANYFELDKEFFSQYYEVMPSERICVKKRVRKTAKAKITKGK